MFDVAVENVCLVSFDGCIPQAVGVCFQRTLEHTAQRSNSHRGTHITNVTNSSHAVKHTHGTRHTTSHTRERK